MSGPLFSRPSSMQVTLALLAMVVVLVAGGVPSGWSEDTDTRLVRETEALSPEEQRQRLKVPEGFEVQLFAAEPQINKPINLAFDDEGRLWVSSTVEYPYSADKSRWHDEEGSRVRESRDAIKILEDTDGDGRADVVLDFADGLNIPTGVLPWHRPEHQAGCLAWSIPNIWYFADTTGDGRADHREVALGPLGYEKDTHGMCSSFRMGTDGWVYATHGFNNTSRFIAGNGRELELHSGNVFRFLPDGSEVEVWSHGQVNPFGLAWDGRGFLYSADCHTAPIYQLLRGANYPSFGKPHDGLGFAPKMCGHSHGSTGICGIVYIDGGVWGEAWDDHMMVGNVVTSRINLDRITYRGSSPRAEEKPDFLVSEDPWFRPVDLQLGPDNALYVADFYNRIIGHYEVPLDHPGRDRERGRIWRIVKKDASTQPRTVTPPAIGGDAGAYRLALRDPSPFVRRRAAEALQDHASDEAVKALFAALAETPREDDHLRHALRVAIREQLEREGAFSAVPEDRSAQREAASIALAVPTPEAARSLLATLEKASADGNDGSSSGLKVRDAWAHIGRYAAEESLQRAIAVARKQGNDAAADTLLKRFESFEALDSGRSEAGAPASPILIGWATELATDLLGRVGDQEPSWFVVPPKIGKSPVWSLRPRSSRDGVEARFLQSLGDGGADQESRSGRLRSTEFTLPEKLSFWICGHLGPPEQEGHHRSKVQLVDVETNEVLAKALPPRSDVAVPVTWELEAHAGKRARLVIEDGDRGRGYAWLGIARVEPPVVDVEAFRGEGAEAKALRVLAQRLQHTAPAALRERLTAYLPPRPAPPPLPVSEEQRLRLDELIATRTAAYEKAKNFDPAVGERVFVTHCAACHQVGGVGGLVGPQLDGIGTRGAARLSEDILDPNRNVDAHFHLRVLSLEDGGTVSGFLKAEVGQVLVLIDAAGQEHRVAKRAITKDEVVPLSLMPAAFDQLIPEREYLELIDWLMKR